ncbi:methyltransferase [Seonamhaeicola sp.]|uniref:class I SAM-dependent methyltransferase n=1 Tax=Seonamhaeicola sp. TaxID=1912245 RepID=UPI0026107006|nr:methyltransferase [Seonamhaeicola sp.]
MTKKSKTPWLTKDVMDQIYEQHLWGGKDFDFYSGYGSHDNNIVKPYLEAVINFLDSFSEPLVVCDLGCGDFNIGKHLTSHTKTYIAVDIVEKLIQRNKAQFKADELEFHCLDISKDDLPHADCVILRQVLQHLSNTEIHQILKKLRGYKYIILTEHVPIGNFIANKDIISGQGIRLKQNSGVNLSESPFHFKIKDQKTLNEHFVENNKGRILTVLYKVF